MDQTKTLTTTHGLEFEAAKWPICEDILLFRVGTCHGQWFYGGDRGPGYYIISIANETPGNGHLDDVFEWFEYACRREGVPLYILAFFNENFRKHCIKKRGFKEIKGTDNVVKEFKK